MEAKTGYRLSIPETKTVSWLRGTRFSWGVGFSMKNRGMSESQGACRILRLLALFPTGSQNVFSNVLLCRQKTRRASGKWEQPQRTDLGIELSDQYH